MRAFLGSWSSRGSGFFGELIDPLDHEENDDSQDQERNDVVEEQAIINRG